MIDSNIPEQPEIPEEILNQGLSQIAQGGLRMDFGGAPQEEQAPAMESGEPTPDEVWNYMAENRYRTFDHTTSQGRRMFELFDVANKEKNTFSFNMVKEMANIVASVPKDIVVGIAQNPLKAPMSALDGVARDINDLYGLMAQSEDPSSPLFKFKEYLTGNGSTEERIKQFNEARMFNNKSQELQDGKRTMLEDFVPEEHKEFIKSMIDPKLANALSYIGLETPHLLLKPFSARKALRQSVSAFKGSDALKAADSADLGSAMSEMINPIREHFNNVAERGKRFASQITGQTIAGTADAIATPFNVIQNKISNGARNIAETTGSNPNVIRNAVGTALADAGETIVGGGASALSPIRSTLFSLGVKPLTEYASALGNEIVDYAQGVVAIKTENMGKSMLERLSLKNGSRVPLSEEARMVAKFTNVVVGWPASMAMPVLKEAVGSAAYMGVLGYLNARGEGAAGAIGVGFAWGGISGSLRHVHNVYNGSLGHQNVISNWDSQINEIEKNSPRHGSALREIVSRYDKINDQRISAVVRASYMQLWSVDKSVELRFTDATELKSEFPNALIGIPKPDNAKGGSIGYQMDKNGVQKKVIWVNKNNFVAEASLHEPAHVLFDHLEETDSDFPNLIRQFFGLDNPDTAVLSDDALASLMAEYKLEYLSMDRSPSNIATFKQGYLSILKQMRAEVKSGSINPNEVDSKGRSKLFEVGADVGKEIFPLREMMTEMFAYSVSNQQLLRTPDFFARHPESSTLRNHFENLHTLMNQKQVSKAEMAGLIIKEQQMGNNDVAFQTFMWEDGTYRSVEPLDRWCETLMRKCLRHGDIDTYTMSPNRLDSYLKTTGKDRFGQIVKGGKTMKDRKEIDILITENAEQMLEIWEKMDPAKRPKIEIEQGGNKKLDLTNVPKDGWDALYGNINMTKQEIDDLRGIVETIRDNRAGKPVFNVFFGQYIGKTHQVIRGGLVQRLTGKDVPVTYRQFSPFAAELRFDKFDENGKQLRESKGHVTLHVVDVAVLNRRRMKMWQRAECRALFKNFAHYTRTFTSYMLNMSQATGIRVESVKLFEKEFGSESAKVRDIMYETFGGRKRVDEGYINIPENGYRGNSDGPNYPFHSLRFELLTNLEKQPSVFSETFGNQLGALPYNHTEAYEGIRRNLMVGTGFRVHDLDNDKKFWSNGSGYEVRTDGTRYRAFSPYGNSIGVYPTAEKAFVGASRHAKKSDPLDASPVVAGEATIKDEGISITPTFAEVLSGRTNLMVGDDGKYHRLGIQEKNNTDLIEFINKTLKLSPTGNEYGTEAYTFDYPTITIDKLVGDNPDGRRFLDVHPYFKGLKVYSHESIAGDAYQGLPFGRNHELFLGINKQLVGSKKFAENVISLLQSEFQKILSHKNGSLPAHLLQVRANTPSGMAYYSAIRGIANINYRFKEWRKNGNPNGTFKQFLMEEQTATAQQIYNSYHDPKKQHFQKLEAIFGNKGDKLRTEIGNWARTLVDSFVGQNPSSFIISQGKASIFVADRALLKLPASIVQACNTDTTKAKWNVVKAFLQRAGGFFHGISKIGDRDTTAKVGGVVIQDPAQDARNTQWSNSNNVLAGNPDIPNFEIQNENLADGLQDFLFLSFAAPFNESINSALIGTHGGVATSSRVKIKSKEPLQGGSQTPEAVSLDQHVLTRAKYKADNVMTDIGASLLFSGSAPFLELKDIGFERHGESYTSIIRDSEHIRMLQEVASTFQFISKDDLQQLTTIGGVERFSRTLWNNGLRNARSRMAYNMALGAMEIMKGIEIRNQTADGQRFLQMYKDSYDKTGTGQADESGIYDPIAFADVLGPNLINDGYSKIVLTLTENGEESLFKLGKNVYSPQTLATTSKDKNAFKIAQVVAKIRRGLDAIEMKIDRPIPLVTNSASLMVGGFKASTAKEMEMMGTGMLRFYKDSRGNTYKSFEFTDASASLNLHAAEGSISKLPFIRMADETKRQAFLQRYSKAVQLIKGQVLDPAKAYSMFKFGMGPDAVLASLPTYDLSEILHHDLLYKFYPKAKDIKVTFVQGYGASFSRADKSIKLGIDRFIGHEIGLDSELSETQKALDAQKFGLDTDRGASDVILHEVQHAIQMEEGWIDSSSLSNSNAYKKVFKYLVGKMSGADLITTPTEGSKITDKVAIEMVTGDQNSLDGITPAEALDSVRKLFNSPMHHRVRKLAVPSLYKTASSIAMMLHDEYAQAPDGFPDKEIAIKHANEMMSIAKEAREIGDDLTQGIINESEASFLLVGHNGSLYMRFKDSKESAVKELNGTPLGRKVDLDEFTDVQYMQEVLGSLSSYERSGNEPWLTSIDGRGATILRELVTHFGKMQYLAQPHEIQASMTGKRRKMSQKALNASATETGYVRSGFEGLESPVTTSFGFGPSLAELGQLLSNGADADTLSRAYGTYSNTHLMVGGLGKGVSVTEMKDKYTPEDTLNYLGRLATVSHHLSYVNEDYQLLKRVAVSGSGFEVDKDGKVRLVFRTAEIQPSNTVSREIENEGSISNVLKDKIPFYKEVQRLIGDQDHSAFSDYEKGLIKNTPFAGVISSYGDIWGGRKGAIITNLLDEGNASTMSFEKIASLLDAKIIMEKIIETPIEAIDLVMNDAFPAVVRLSDLKSYLVQMGISNDGLVLGNIDAITERAQTQDVTYTKQELINILAINHQIFTAEASMGSAFGKNVLLDTIKEANLDPQQLGLGIVKSMGFEVIKRIVGDLTVGGDNHEIGFRHDYNLNQAKSKFFEISAGGIVFNAGSRPDWISLDAWVALMDRIREKGIVVKEESKRYPTLVGDYLEANDNQKLTNTLYQRAIELNDRLFRKFFLIKPFYEKVAKSIEDKTIHVDEKMMLQIKVSMLSDALLSSSEFRSEGLILSSTEGKMLPNIIASTESSTRTRNEHFGYETSQRPFGSRALNINALGTMATSNEALISGRLVQSPAVSMFVPAGWGYDSSTYKNGSFGPMSEDGLNIASMVYNYESLGSDYSSNRMMYNIGRHYSAITTSVRFLRQIASHYTETLASLNTNSPERAHINETLTKIRDLADIATSVSLRYDALTALGGAMDRVTQAETTESRVSKVQSVFGSTSFRSKDGTIVITNLEPVRANAYESHAGLTDFPYLFSGKPIRQNVPQEAVRKLGDMNTAFMRNDYERQVMVNADIVDENGNVVRSALDVSQNMLDASLTSRKIWVRSQGANGDSTGYWVTLRPSRKIMISGMHALHSSMYQVCAMYGITTEVLSNTLVLGGGESQIIDLLKNHTKFFNIAQNASYGVSHNDGNLVTGSQFASVLAPFFAKALSDKQVVFSDGVAGTSDILSLRQREMYNNLFTFSMEEVRVDFEKQKDLQKRCQEFIESLSSSQRNAIAGSIANGTIGELVNQSLGVMNSLLVLDLIPDAEFVHLDALLGRSFKQEMKTFIGYYARDSASFWEKGLNQDVSPSENGADGYSHSYLRDATLACFNSEFMLSFVLSIKNLDKFDGVEHVKERTEGGITALSKTDGVGVLHSDSIQFANRESYSFSPISETQAFASGIDDTYDHNKLVVEGISIKQRAHVLENRTLFNHFRNKANRKQEKLVRSGVGMGQTFLKPIDIVSESNSADVQISQEAAQSTLASSKIVSAGSSLSRTLVRKRMVAYISSLAKNGNGNVAVEPARFSMSGRGAISASTTRMEALARQGTELKRASINSGILSIGLGQNSSQTMVVASRNEPTTKGPTGNAVYDRAMALKNTQETTLGQMAPFEHKPQYGFAFKKLEDGSIVVNVTGDVHSPKHLLSKRSARVFYKEAGNSGFSIKEGLGFDPYTKTIIPHGPRAAQGTFESGVELFSVLTNKIGGPAWMKEIVKASNQLAKNGFAESRDMRAVAYGTNDFSVDVDAGRTLEAVLNGEASESKPTDVYGAYALLHHNMGHDYLTVTFRPNTPIDEIRAGIHQLVVGNGARTIIKNSGFGDGGNAVDLSNIREMQQNPFLGAVENQLTYANDADVSRRTGAGSTEPLAFASVIRRLRHEGTSGSSQKTNYYNELHNHAQLTSALHPHLMDDIDILCGQIASKDSGYFLPSTERLLAMNGDKAAVIELMFPDRPELMNYAWDGKSESDVSIVPKKDYSSGARGKVTGYLVGYNHVSGVNEFGRPIVSRRVVQVKTMPEAEALRTKFAVSTSKAEMALILDSLSNETQKDIRLVEQVGGGASKIQTLITNFSTVVNEPVHATGGIITSGKRTGYRVGEMDKVFATKEEAVAAKAMMDSGEVLSTPRANLMVGDRRTPSELENLTRAKLNFGSGYGPFEFTSKLMKVVAYAKKKTGRDLFPLSMSGNDWFKHIKENQVSKDEIRQSGLALLLYEMGDRQISRQELAEFLYTMHPQMIRIIRNTKLDREIGQQRNPEAGKVYFPFISDLVNNANTVTDNYFRNLETIANAIDTFTQNPDETVSSTGRLAEIAAIEALTKMVEENGLMNVMPDTKGLTFRQCMVKLRAHYLDQFEDVSPANMYSGPNITVRPAYLSALQTDILGKKVESIGKTVNEILGHVATTDPYHPALASIGPEMLGFSHTQLTSYGTGAGPLGKGGLGTHQQNPSAIWNMGAVYRHSNDHADWAGSFGPYSSQVLQVEQQSARQLAEFNSYIKDMERRLTSETDTAEKDRLAKIITGARAVMEIRERFTKANGIADAGHYSDNPRGMLQLGHLRVSEGISLNETNGLAIHENGYSKPNYPIGGTKVSREPLIVIEEIQSDVFQYKSFGLPASSANALPEDFSQVEGLKKSGELVALQKRVAELENTTHTSEQGVNEVISKLTPNSKRTINRQVNSGLVKKVLAMITPIEIYAFVKGHSILEDARTKEFVADTGRKMEVPEEYRKVLSVSEIPVYTLLVDNHKFAGMYGNNDSDNLSAIRNMLGESFKIDRLCRSINVKIHETIAQLMSNSNVTQNAQVNSMRTLFMDIMLSDENLAASSPLIFDHYSQNFDLGTYDFDSLAGRVIAEIDKRIETFKAIGGQHLDLADKETHIQIMSAISQEVKEMAMASRDSMRTTAYSHQGTALISDNMPSGAFKKKYSSDENFLRRNTEKTDSSASVASNVLGFGIVAPSEYITAGSMDDTAFGYMLDGNYSNVLSKILASISLPAVNYYMGSVARGKITELQAQITELQKVVPISSGGSEPFVSTSMFFGVEDIYRNVSFHSTIMKAAAVGYNQIGLADARSHFTRGNSTNIKSAGTIGRSAFLLTSSFGVQEATFNTLALFQSLPEQIRASSHGNFEKLFRTFSDAELVSLGNGGKISHNGLEAGIDTHVFAMLQEAQSKINIEYPKHAPYLNYIVGLNGNDLGFAAGIKTAIKQQSNLIGPDGKPVKHKNLDYQKSSLFFRNQYGELGENKNSTQRFIDQIAINAGQVGMVVETENKWGYVSNYGLPMHYMEMMYNGQTRSALEAVSTDSFDRPVMEIKHGSRALGVDDEFIFLDPKTAKEIGRTSNKDHAIEMYSQLSKYRGKNPYIKMFEKEYGPLGGYFKTAFNHGVGVEGDSIAKLMYEDDARSDTRSRVADEKTELHSFTDYEPYVDTERKRGSSTLFTSPTPTSIPEAPPRGPQSKGMWTGYQTSKQSIAIMMLNRDIEPDSEAGRKFIASMDVPSVTLMRFKPKFPSEQHRLAWRKKAIDGISFLMVGGDGSQKPRATPLLLEQMKQVATFTNRASNAYTDDETSE